MDFYVTITTYNRQKELGVLIDQIRSTIYGKWKVVIYQDGGQEYSLIPPKGFVLKRYPHQGREKWYRLINRIFYDATRENFNQYINLQDDVCLCDDFFKQVYNRWYALQFDPKAMMLNMMVDSRGHKPQWGIYKVDKIKKWLYTYYLSQWSDMFFTTDKRFFDVIKKLSGASIQSSSGVGRDITKQIRKHGNIYQVDKTLIHHGNHESLMNPLTRKKDPICTKN